MALIKPPKRVESTAKEGSKDIENTDIPPSLIIKPPLSNFHSLTQMIE